MIWRGKGKAGRRIAAFGRNKDINLNRLRLSPGAAVTYHYYSIMIAPL
jgi:hypothetical protein